MGRSLPSLKNTGGMVRVKAFLIFLVLTVPFARTSQRKRLPPKPLEKLEKGVLTRTQEIAGRQDQGASVQETVWTVMICRHIEVQTNYTFEEVVAEGCGVFKGFLPRGNNVPGYRGADSDGPIDCAQKCNSDIRCAGWSLLIETNECWLKNTTSVTLGADPEYTEEEEYLSGFSCPGSPCSEDKCVEACAEGWEENGHHHCYLFGNEKKNWTAVEDFCREEKLLCFSEEDTSGAIVMWKLISSSFAVLLFLLF